MISPEKTPLVSVVVSFRNSEQTLAECIEGLCRQTYDNYELIFVDDRSTDLSEKIVRKYGFEPIKSSMPWPRSINEGAEKAKGSILFFTDSDVYVPPATLSKIVRAMENRKWDAIVGTYTADHPNQNLCSQYKNLWIRHSYLNGFQSINFAFGAVTASRRDAFLSIGGYRSTFRIDTAGADLDLGINLTNHDYRIKLDTSVEVTHLKKYDFIRLMKNELFRSTGYIHFAVKRQMLMKSIQGGIGNISTGFVWSVAILWLFLFSAVLSVFFPPTAMISAFLVILYMKWNYSFLAFYTRHRKMSETIGIIPILICDHLICGIGCSVGFIIGLVERLRTWRISRIFCRTKLSC